MEVVPVGVMWQVWCVFEIDNVGGTATWRTYNILQVWWSGSSEECMSSCGYLVVEVMGNNGRAQTVAEVIFPLAHWRCGRDRGEWRNIGSRLMWW